MSPRKKRPLKIEQLQPREVFTVDSAVWEDAATLRLSFVPDGTLVGENVSTLNSVLSQSAAGPAWREAIAQAFQIWAQYAPINVGIVDDNGEPIGITGPTHGDSRFGDIRVAGVPMATDNWAAAIDQHKLATGSWSGDMFFNTDADWNHDPSDLLRVALHEAGHVLGLPHNNDPNSPMHTHGIPSSLVPAASDIALLQEMYGTRGPDSNEIAKSNDRLGDATRLRFSDVTSHFDGTTPLIHFGEIQNSQDRDIFFFQPPNKYSGPTTIHVLSAGLSMLQFRATVLDKNGNVLATGTSTAKMGGDVSISLPSIASNAETFIQVDPIGDPFARQGSYVVVASLDELNTVPFAETRAIIERSHRWFALSADSLLNLNISTLADNQHSLILDDEAGLDDSVLDARRIDPFIDTPQISAARTIGTLATATDIDYYRFRSPKPPAGKHFGMLLQVDSIETDGLMPEIQVVDLNNQIIPTEMLVNGNGEVKVWLANVLANTDYNVRIVGQTAEHAIGNYEITASFQENKPVRNVLATKTVTSEEPEQTSVWYVGQSQLFSLALNVTSPDHLIVPAWVIIYDSQMRAVTSLMTESGIFRTGASALLLPGTYYLQFGARFEEGLTTPAQLNFELLGFGDLDPLGATPTNPTELPIFDCGGQTSEFCYPNQAPTPAPFVIVPTVPATPPVQLPSTNGLPVTPPPSHWFWNSQPPRWHASLPFDCSGDGVVSGLDVLLVINFINTFAPGLMPPPPVEVSGMIDVNNDGNASAIDALLVINYLNNPANAEGEGPATTTSVSSSSIASELLSAAYASADELATWKRSIRATGLPSR